jgi:hypothetical protein
MHRKKEQLTQGIEANVFKDHYLKTFKDHYHETFKDHEEAKVVGASRRSKEEKS